MQRSSRVADPKQHTTTGTRSSPYRKHRRYIIAELDLKPGDTVVDIGAGDGWWAQRMARGVGANGVVHAAEVSKRKVAQMKRRFTKMPQVKPYLCPLDRPGLPENSCDLAFLAQTYHHLPKDRVAYLRGLKRVIKPTGRLCIIERYLELGERKTTHGTKPNQLLAAAQKSGWVLVRFELLPKTNHYLSMFVQKELFKSERRGRQRGREGPRREVAPADAPTESDEVRSAALGNGVRMPRTQEFVDTEPTVRVTEGPMHREAGGLDHRREVPALVGELGQDLLARLELEETLADADRLVGRADEVHLDSTLQRVEDGFVSELLDLDLRAEVALHADQQVEVEARRHPS